MQRRLLLDVVVGQRAPVLKLLAGEDKTLLVGRDTLLVLNLRLHVVDGVRRLDLKGDGLAREGLNEDLHAAAQTEHEVESGLLLDVVVREGAAILELLAGEDQALLVRRDTLLILNLAFDGLDGIGRLDLESDSLAGQSLDKDLHTTTETKD